ncbi:MAG TPA: bifunctional precorrin-2 dehydrogenase/sirohydrochlorin ferrochelatase [Candidatus Aquilonibacter sp.]|nr:bifunctional precorrin-2 dehydrogenase/sirohydrochlorin ferrochelatase [Candidatus Aquilonibacter sp.]
MILFPAFLKLAGRRCVVAGAGPVAEEKIEGLLRAGAKVRVVAPEATERIRGLARAKKIGWEKRAYRASDLEGAFVVVAATSSPALHARIYREAQRRGVLCNVVDDPEHCNFYYGSVVRRGTLQIAISTAGHSPALAQRLRKKLEEEFGAGYEEWLEELGKMRKQLFAKKMAPEKRKALLHELASEASFEKFLGRKKGKARF